MKKTSLFTLIFFIVPLFGMQKTSHDDDSLRSIALGRYYMPSSTDITIIIGFIKKLTNVHSTLINPDLQTTIFTEIEQYLQKTLELAKAQNSLFTTFSALSHFEKETQNVSVKTLIGGHIAPPPLPARKQSPPQSPAVQPLPSTPHELIAAPQDTDSDWVIVPHRDSKEDPV